jgi:hypothetical protein
VKIHAKWKCCMQNFIKPVKNLRVSSFRPLFLRMNTNIRNSQNLASVYFKMCLVCAFPLFLGIAWVGTIWIPSIKDAESFYSRLCSWPSCKCRRYFCSLRPWHWTWRMVRHGTEGPHTERDKLPVDRGVKFEIICIFTGSIWGLHSNNAVWNFSG